MAAAASLAMGTHCQETAPSAACDVPRWRLITPRSSRTVPGEMAQTNPSTIVKGNNGRVQEQLVS
jgi:hypothetical protein